VPFVIKSNYWYVHCYILKDTPVSIHVSCRVGTDSDEQPADNKHTHTHNSCPPLIVGNVQVLVDGEEGLFEEDDPLSLLILRLVKNGLHLFHVARSVAVHLLQDFFIAGTNLNIETRFHTPLRAALALHRHTKAEVTRPNPKPNSQL